MTPDQAEAEVVRLGLEPFASEPDPACFDPLRETFWTPVMAVAWIAWRTLEAVREWWNAYRAECSDWHFRRWRVGPEGPIHEGHFLEQRRPAALMDIRLAAIWADQAGEDTAVVMTVPGAIEALWIALREGLFDATALPPEGGPRRPVPAAQWHDLKPYDDGNDQIAAHLFGAHRIEYREVLVPSAAVVGLWRARTPDVAHGLPEVVKPEGAGYMPLYYAAQWIATKGGAVAFDPHSVDAWRPAYADLLARIASGDIDVTGLASGERQPIEGYRFADCRVDYPFSDPPSDLVLGAELRLCSFPYIDDEHWRGGFDDSLRNRNGIRWSRLMLRKDDVARLWPFSLEARLRTGAPGRPSSMHLIEAEFERRVAQGQVEASLAVQARVLAQWLRDLHPAYPKAGKTAIENNIRLTYKQARSPGNNISR